MHSRPIRTLTIAMLTIAMLFASVQARRLDKPTAPDFNAARDETVQILSGFVRIDTSNPPGNETKGAEYLKAILDREGIPSEIFEKDRGRGNIVARLKGNAQKKPVLLMGHIDVVGVEREKWTVDPFGGTIKDGYLYGRGALDTKELAAMELMVLLLLKREGISLSRDVILMANADEEAGGHQGAGFMVKNFPDLIRAEFAINEGGGGVMRKGKYLTNEVQAAEKVYQDIRLEVHNSGGHSSMPVKDNAIYRLAAGLARLEQYEFPVELNEVTRAYFARSASIETGQTAADLGSGPGVPLRESVAFTAAV